MPSSACKTSAQDRTSTRLNSSHTIISYAVFCLRKNECSSSEEHTSELQSHDNLVCRLLLENKGPGPGHSCPTERRCFSFKGPQQAAREQCPQAAQRLFFFKVPAHTEVSPFPHLEPLQN